MNKLATVRYNVTLTQEEFDKITDLLDKTVDDQLATDLREVTHIPAAKHMYFINIYSIEQHYGGPEEGGWYYHTVDCYASFGVYCDPHEHDTVWSREHRFDLLAREASNYTVSLGPSWPEPVAAATIISDLLEDDCYYIESTDRYGNGEALEISRTLGAMHDNRSHHYE